MPALENWIQEQLDAGYSQEQILQSLLDSGYSEQEARSTLKKVLNQRKFQTKPMLSQHKGIISLLIILLVISTAAAYLYPEFKTNNTETREINNKFFSNFTPYMKEKINSKLNHINCNPKRYYLKSIDSKSSICFVCGSGHPCFEYSLVSRGEKEKMNPGGTEYYKSEDFTVDVVNFYKYGLASKLNCIEDNKTKLSCDHSIIFVINESSLKKGYFISNDINMILEDPKKWDETSDIICKKLEGEEATCEKNEKIREIIEKTKIKTICSCNGTRILMKDRKIHVLR